MPNMRTWYRGIVALFIVLFLPCYSLGLTWPSPSGSVTSGYGLRIPPAVVGASDFHRGLDISTGGGPTPLLATADGEINEIVFRPDFGNRIRWGGDTGWSYNHLSNSQTPNWVFGERATARGGGGEIIEMRYIAINTTSGLKYYIPYDVRLPENVEITLRDGSRHPASYNITESHLIAYSGNTGGLEMAVHLHLIKYKGSGETNTENPLRHYYSAGVRSNPTPPRITNLTYDKIKTMISAEIDTGQ